MQLPIPIGRQLWVMVHRWAGLTIALFLIVAGSTGALLPFQEELTLLARLRLSAVRPPLVGARPLNPFVLAQLVEKQTGGRVTFVDLDVPTKTVARINVVARAGNPALGYDQVWADPYTGQIRLRHRYGVLADGAQNIMPFLYEVHYSLALGEWGVWAFGVAALVWTIDCFAGFYLTLPMRRTPAAAKRLATTEWWRRWRPAWTIRKGARGYKLNFDLHRASGLWLWPVLFVFAWSSVGFNLPYVHQPVMLAFGAKPPFERPALPHPLNDPALDIRTAASIGNRLLAIRAQDQGFSVERPSAIVYYPDLGLYRYLVRTNLDIVDKGGLTTVWIDARSGEDRGFEQSTGETVAGTTMEWMSMLHMAQVFGLPYRIFVSLLGLAVVGLSVTGIAIWMKKRSARLLGRKRAPRRQVNPVREMQATK